MCVIFDRLHFITYVDVCASLGTHIHICLHTCIIPFIINKIIIVSLFLFFFIIQEFNRLIYSVKCGKQSNLLFFSFQDPF